MRVEVESSNIEYIEYYAPKAELTVGFLNGSQYVYFDVPQETFDNFVAASSKGRFLNQEVKNVYYYEKVM